MSGLLRWWRPLAGYGTALVSVTLATLLTRLVEPLQERCTFLLFVAAVAVTAWHGSLGPSLLATGLSVLALDFFFLPPIYSLSIGFADAVNVMTFVLVAFLIPHERRLSRHCARRCQRAWIRSSPADGRNPCLPARPRPDAREPRPNPYPREPPGLRGNG